jgi:hypothetical protein
MRVSVFFGLLALVVPVQAEAKSDCALMQQLAQEHSNNMARRESLDIQGFPIEQPGAPGQRT